MKLLGALTLVVAGVLALAGCSGSKADKADVSTIVFTVTGPQKAAITYSDGSSTSSGETRVVNLPWTKEVKSRDRSAAYEVSAQDPTNTDEQVSCTVTVDNKIVDHNVGKGQSVITACRYGPS